MLLVDDDCAVLLALGKYFSLADDIQIVSEARDGAEALIKLDCEPVDVVLADIYMPDLGGIELLRSLREMENPPAFVAMTAFDDDEIMLEVLALGGAGYIIKSDRPQEIIAAVRDVAKGGTNVSPQALSRLVGYIPKTMNSAVCLSQSTISELYRCLTSVEKRILFHLCGGLSNSEIASAMHYSEITVKKHVSKLLSHFGVSSRLNLVVMIYHAKF